jgi:histidinol dehydrogenase
MIKILNSKNKRFDFILDKLLGKRKNKVQIETVSVVRILKDVKKMEIKQLLNMKKNLITIKL